MHPLIQWVHLWVELLTVDAERIVRVKLIRAGEQGIVVLDSGKAIFYPFAQVVSIRLGLDNMEVPCDA